MFRKILFIWNIWQSMPIFSFIGCTPTELFRKSDNWRQIYKQKSSTFYTSNICLKRVEKKKLLEPPNKDISLNKKMRKQPPEVFYKKAVIKNLAIFTEKHLCWSLVLIQNIEKFVRAPILKNICERLLLKMCLWNWEKLKIAHKEF